MKQTLIQFPSRPMEPEHEDRLGPVRCAAWVFAFEVALCIAAALALGRAEDRRNIIAHIANDHCHSCFKTDNLIACEGNCDVACRNSNSLCPDHLNLTRLGRPQCPECYKTFPPGDSDRAA
jgi:hypothetical protein